MTATVGFIGTGNMGAAIIRGLAARDDISLIGFDLNREGLAALAAETGMTAAASAAEAAQADYVIMAVKPQHMKPLCKELALAFGDHTVVLSIAAGLGSDKLRDWTGGQHPVVRVMPNTPAMVGAGVFAVCLEDKALSEAQKALITGIFQPLGQVHVLAESQFDAFTAIAGSGPAYVFSFMEAVIEAGVTLGLTRAQTTEMVQGLFSGSAKLACENDLHLSLLREMVCSPGGTTIQATNHFDAKGVRASIIEGIIKCHDRSVELGK